MYDTHVTKYKAPSGLTVVHFDVDGPLVNAYLTLATEVCFIKLLKASLYSIDYRFIDPLILRRGIGA